MIELTPEQRQALDGRHGEPVRVVDPSTQDAYMIVRADVFERMAGVLQIPVDEPPPGINPLMLRSMKSFWRDLPELLKLKSRPRRFVAYHGEDRIGFGRTQTELYQECFRRGLQRGEFYVGLLEEREAPPWGSTPLEQSLYEGSDAPISDDPRHG
jgi:hypothetical protein